jgi:hypothetical protein
MEMHHSIEQAATRMAAQLQSSKLLSLLYPPNNGLAEDEIAAIGRLQKDASLESAMRKVIASAASEPLYHLISILDGIGDPRGLNEVWLGARIEPNSDEADGSEDIEPLRYDFYESYWAWRQCRPNPGWRLDTLGTDEPPDHAYEV